MGLSFIPSPAAGTAAIRDTLFYVLKSGETY